MKPMQTAMQKWMQENENFQENYMKMKNEILQDSEIKAFLQKHPQLARQEIDKNLIKLYEYKTQSKQCSACTSFANCKNMIQGYSPILYVENNEIHLSYEKCHNKIMNEKEKSQQNLIQSLYIPKEIFNATFEDITSETERNEAFLGLVDFIKQATQGQLPKRGIYFHGPFGVGKTYFLGVLANELKKINISSTLIYMPEFVREMKSSLGNDTVNTKVDYFKKADVLMLDDIGAEMESAWFRDEILGSILQYRMMENLPVFFTSNYSLKQLQNQLADTRSGVEEVKAGRIIERIKQVSRIIEMNGLNKRE